MRIYKARENETQMTDLTFLNNLCVTYLNYELHLNMRDVNFSNANSDVTNGSCHSEHYVIICAGYVPVKVIFFLIKVGNLLSLSFFLKWYLPFKS